MGILLKSNYKRFKVSFSPTFFDIFDDIVEKYTKIIRKQPDIFTDIVSYLEHSITSFPEGDYGGSPIYQSGSAASWGKTFGGPSTIDQRLDRTLSLEFSTFDGYLGYYFLRDVLYAYHEMPDEKLVTYLPYIIIFYMDAHGIVTHAERYEHVVFTSLTPNMDKSYSTNIGEFRTFTAEFYFQYFVYYDINEVGN